MMGNNLRENWYMGDKQRGLSDLGDLRSAIEGFSDGYKIKTPDGKSVSLRMSEGVIIIEASE